VVSNSKQFFNNSANAHPNTLIYLRLTAPTC
jgi:hypothetical protein